MVKRMVLFDKLHVLDTIASQRLKDQVVRNYEKYIGQLTRDFNSSRVVVKKIRQYDTRPELIISGPEEVFIYNMLKSEIGLVHDFEEIKIGDTLKGLMVDVGKVGFGIFVDCGIFQPNTDVLLPLHELRDQLCKGKTIPVREIIEAFGFCDRFPVYVKITKIDPVAHKLEGKLADETIQFFTKIVDEGIEAIIASGETKGQVKKALIEKGHLRDIVSIERYTFFEHIVIFKEETNAPGIIAEIGSRLKGCKLNAIRASKIKKYFKK